MEDSPAALRKRIEALDGEVSDQSEQRLQEELLGLLKQKLRPEFLNRIDETVLFHPLGKEEIRQIVEIQFGRIQELAARSHEVRLHLSDAAMDWLAARGFDPAFGARPLKRVLQREITNKLAEEVLSGWISDGETVHIDLADDASGLTFETIAETAVATS